MIKLFGLMRGLKGWKTLGVSSAIAVAGVLQTADWTTIVPPDRVGQTLLVIGVVVALLRVLTNSPVGQR